MYWVAPERGDTLWSDLYQRASRAQDALRSPKEGVPNMNSVRFLKVPAPLIDQERQLQAQ